MSMGVHNGCDVDPVRVNDFHESGGKVHAPTEPVGLSADDGVKAPNIGVGQHPLELRALLGPAPAHLLVAWEDSHAFFLAVVFHVADLLEDGGLVHLGLVLVQKAGVGGCTLRFRLPIGSSHHTFLLLVLPETKKTHLPSGADQRAV